MFGHKTNRALFALLLLAAALPVPAMTPALLSGKLGLMAAVSEGADLPLHADVWRYLAPRTPLLGEERPEPALLGWMEPEVVPIIPAETLALPADNLVSPLVPFQAPLLRPTVFTPPLAVGGAKRPTTAISPVPEPATWMVLICGFALVGAALRVRRLGPSAEARAT